MGRMYVTSFENVTVAGVQDFFEIVPADDKPCVFHALFLSNASATIVGDLGEDLHLISVERGMLTVGSGGGTDNEVPVNPNDVAASYTGGINNTTIATTGTPVDLHAEAFNNRTGLQLVWTPEMRPIVTQAQTMLVVRLMADTNDSIELSGSIYVEET